MGRFNKATAALVAGAIVSVVGSFLALTPEVQGAAITLITAALVWLVPNTEG